jgi:hypothetical protein
MEPHRPLERPGGTMRRILVCTGVLGGGTALVFALATLTAIAFPNGSTMATSWGGGWAKPMLMGVEPVPALVERAVIVDDAGADWPVAVPGPVAVPAPEPDRGSAGF